MTTYDWETGHAQTYDGRRGYVRYPYSHGMTDPDDLRVLFAVREACGGALIDGQGAAWKMFGYSRPDFYSDQELHYFPEATVTPRHAWIALQVARAGRRPFCWTCSENYAEDIDYDGRRYFAHTGDDRCLARTWMVEDCYRPAAPNRTH